jgi:type VI secretion system protein ImpJ
LTTRHRVIWSQGMFLQPHHFQQEARFVEHLVDTRVRAAEPYAWGFAELVIDEAQLALGRMALARASGVLTDGTPFSMPDGDALPAALAVAADVQSEIIYLAAPQARVGVTEVDFGDGAADAMSRYTVTDQELRDHTHATDDPEPVQTGAVRLRLLRQRDLTDALPCWARCAWSSAASRRPGGAGPRLHRAADAHRSQRPALHHGHLLHGLVQQKARRWPLRWGR